jgi:FHS family glucose/mannose:H+ symporter-like MFS transporter
MHVAFILCGLGTMMLGPLLPLLASQWHLKDSQSGLLLMAQFCGATLGGGTTSQRLRWSLKVGLVCATAGYLGFALAPGLLAACAGLAVAGFGVGRSIATINIMAGARYTEHRGAALSWLNFSWSFGALLSPLCAAWLASRFQLSHLLLIFACLFLWVLALVFLQMRGAGEDGVAATSEQASGAMRGSLLIYFAGLMVLYGGLETCLSGWLTTYALRYGKTSLVLSEYTMVLFLCGLTAGRALAAWMLMRVRDRTLLRISLLLAALLAAALALAHTATMIAVFAVLLGICLAPIFPATFALVMATRPPARQAGMIMAASGIGAASLPWLMGVISTQSGSLQIALVLPALAALVMLLLAMTSTAGQSART